MAAMEGNVDMMRMLLNACADENKLEMMNSVTNDEESPLDFAVQSKNIEAVKFCLNYGTEYFRARIVPFYNAFITTKFNRSTNSENLSQ